MPIKKIERQLDEQGVLGNMPRFGKLRKGGEKTEKSSGRDLDHFRLTLEPEYEDKIRPAFEQLFGKEPTEFHNVLIAADSADAAFDYWFETWSHAKLVRRCDGEEICMSFSEGEQRYDTTPHACTCNPLDRECKQTGRMGIVIPALFDETGLWGKFTVLTTSLYDVIALRSSMKLAGAFMQKLPNVAFWSLPFTVGRALRKVPVTINGKRSIKPMHLLYAHIEPDFNREVFNPLLTQPTQLLLQGVNPETGELPEIEIEQAASWNREWVEQETIHLFDHENHWDNTINPMIAAGELDDDMDDATVIELITENRAVRKAQKAAGNGSKSRQKGSNSSAASDTVQTDASWIKDTARLNKFIASAYSELGLNTGDVHEALKAVSTNEKLENIQDFTGSDLTAWTACVLLKYGYNSGDVFEVYSSDSMIGKEALRLIEIRQQRLADIPF